ncbi:response regulator [Pseudomonas abietaniphila]|nr:response regulator [Pseudomonas abietaniphila]
MNTHPRALRPRLTPRHILLADDHPVVLLGARMSLSNGRHHGASISDAHNADQLIEHLHHRPCELLITDFSMPDSQKPDGLALISYIRRHFEALDVIVMSMFDSPALWRNLLDLGVRGLFDKQDSLTELDCALDTVCRGHIYISPSIGDRLDTPACDTHTDSALSIREVEVVRLLYQGLSGRQIAERLNRSEKTVSRHKRTAMQKLGLIHDSGLIEYGRALGLNGASRSVSAPRRRAKEWAV